MLLSLGITGNSVKNLVWFSYKHFHLDMQASRNTYETIKFHNLCPYKSYHGGIGNTPAKYSGVPGSNIGPGIGCLD
jgi:hypothetical protein